MNLRMVIYGALDSAEGSYVIEYNKIKITYHVAYDPDDQSLNEFPNVKEEELIIVDENTLTSEKVVNGVTYNGKYVKQ